jgi:hypothetical protein
MAVYVNKGPFNEPEHDSNVRRASLMPGGTFLHDENGVSDSGVSNCTTKMIGNAWFIRKDANSSN